VHALIILGTLGSLIGFLFFNWHPSKLFMGDTGSQFLGLILAAFGIVYFWNTPYYRTDHILQPAWLGDKLISTTPPPQPMIISKQLITVLLAFIIPIADTTSVFIGRIARGQSPFVGGKDHTTHHLSYLGLSDSQVAIAFSGISLISMVLIFVVQYTIDTWTTVHALIFGAYIVVAMGLLFYVTRLNRDRHVKE
jgi:UDP-GlcNAc:undecaprenyl-phosphate GlcNAc-1-phosphate transferase